MQRGFTLAELLIALAILGVIATFTIPKVLQSQQSGQYNAVAKETVGMISGAFQAYQQNNTVTGNTAPGDLTPYMNYVRRESIQPLDQFYTYAANIDCSDPNENCYLLHNGAALNFRADDKFNTTHATSAIWFEIDPDGKVTTDGSATSPGKSLVIFIYPNGRLVDWSGVSPNTQSACCGGGNYGPDPSHVPPWFSWN